MRVHVRRADTGPTLVLLHGSGASLHVFDAVTDLLVDRFDVVRPDLPGFGLTGPRPDATTRSPHRLARRDRPQPRRAGRTGLDRRRRRLGRPGARPDVPARYVCSSCDRTPRKRQHHTDQTASRCATELDGIASNCA
ncbi:alpha/beta fold hydrolase [Phytohabitans maris]|uniref:alpha/beta fold hydrolase n=1 Tax=Phytohabitans maris TaxID=3071409 RepID=UPI003D185482